MTEPTPLGRARAALVALSAAVATRDPQRLEAALRRAAADAATEAVEEALLQSHLFVGFPLALEALTHWARLRPDGPAAPADDGPEIWRPRGERVCATVYGGNYQKLRRNVAALHPDLDRWMVEGGYGRVIGRSGLDLATRELCIAALLAVWDTPRQLHSHLRGALNAGASRAEVDEAMRIAGAMLDPRRAAEVAELWRQVRESAVAADLGEGDARGPGAPANIER